MPGLRGENSGGAMMDSTTFLSTDGDTHQLGLFESAQEAESEAEAEELKYKSEPGAFWNGRIWTIPADVPF
jgi:hypothetical protein